VDAATALLLQLLQNQLQQQLRRVFIGGVEYAGPENDGPNRRAGKCKTWTITDQIAVLVLENVYFYYGENSFTGVLSSKFTGQKNALCLLQSNVEYYIQAWLSDVYAKTYISLYYTVIATNWSQGISW